MKIKSLILLLLTFAVKSHAQFLTKTGDGNNAFLFRGSNVTINPGATAITFGINNVQRTIAEKCKSFYGISGSTKNEEGLGSFLSTGSLAPSGTLGGFYGWSKSNTESLNKQERLTKALSDRGYAIEAIRVRLASIVSQATDAIFRDMLIKKVAEMSKEDTQLTFSDLATDLAPDDKDPKALKADKNLIRPQYDKVIIEAKSLSPVNNSSITKRNIEYANALSNDSLEFSNRTYYHIGFFGFAGFKATSFKQYLGIDPITLSKNFTDVNYRGRQVGLGVNVRWSDETGENWVITSQTHGKSSLLQTAAL